MSDESPKIEKVVMTKHKPYEVVEVTYTLYLNDGVQKRFPPLEEAKAIEEMESWARTGLILDRSGYKSHDREERFPFSDLKKLESYKQTVIRYTQYQEEINVWELPFQVGDFLKTSRNSETITEVTSIQSHWATLSVVRQPEKEKGWYDKEWNVYFDEMQLREVIKLTKDDADEFKLYSILYR